MLTPSEMIDIVNFLENYGIEAEGEGAAITVNRDSICNAIPEHGEEEAYSQVIDMLKERFPGRRYYWAMKTDDDLFLDSIN